MGCDVHGSSFACSVKTRLAVAAFGRRAAGTAGRRADDQRRVQVTRSAQGSQHGARGAVAAPSSAAKPIAGTVGATRAVGRAAATMSQRDGCPAPAAPLPCAVFGRITHAIAAHGGHYGGRCRLFGRCVLRGGRCLRYSGHVLWFGSCAPSCGLQAKAEALAAQAVARVGHCAPDHGAHCPIGTGLVGATPIAIAVVGFVAGSKVARAACLGCGRVHVARALSVRARARFPGKSS